MNEDPTYEFERELQQENQTSDLQSALKAVRQAEARVMEGLRSCHEMLSFLVARANGHTTRQPMPIAPRPSAASLPMYKDTLPEPPSSPQLDLDSEHGNFEVRKDPPLWIRDGGESWAGRRLSECPIAYLVALESFRLWSAGASEKKGTPDELKSAGFARLDARRIRGWIERKQRGGSL